MKTLAWLLGFGRKASARRCSGQGRRFRPRMEALEDRLVPAFLLVDPVIPGAFHTIQSAINAANAGDVISVDPAVYNEHILINKRLTLIGSGLPVIKGPGANSLVENIVRIADNLSGVAISGFDIQDPNGRAKFQVGVAIGAGDSTITLTSNLIHDVRDSTQAVGGGTLTVGVLINPRASSVRLVSNTIGNILYSTQGVGSSGQTAYGIYSFSRSATDGQNGMVFTNNSLTNIGDIAIAVNDASSNTLINANIITQVLGLNLGNGIINNITVARILVAMRHLQQVVQFFPNYFFFITA